MMRDTLNVEMLKLEVDSTASARTDEVGCESIGVCEVADDAEPMHIRMQENWHICVGQFS